MLELGKRNDLRLDRIRSNGAYLMNDSNDRVLLPRKEVGNLKVGDRVSAFILKDNKNRFIATLKSPFIEVGQIGILRCVSANRYGAFLDWGLDKDLLLPFDEQTRKVKMNDYVLVRAYIDNASDRICASMNLKGFFPRHPKVKENDWIKGRVYSINEDIGYFILVEDKYDGLLPIEEADSKYRIGDEVRLRVSNIKPDGKIDLSSRNRQVEEISRDAKNIYDKIVYNGGFMKVNDKSNPQMIKRIFSISKAQFKRSIGHLLKLKKISFVDGGIKINRRENGRKQGNISKSRK